MLKFDKATYLSFLFKFISSEEFRNNLWGSDVSLISNAFLVISSTRYKEYIICWNSFIKFSDVLYCASVIGNLWSICLGAHILNCVRLKTLRSERLATGTTQAESKGRKADILELPFPCVSYIGNIHFWMHQELILDLHREHFRFLSLPSFVFGLDLLINDIIFLRNYFDPISFMHINFVGIITFTKRSYHFILLKTIFIFTCFIF